MIVPRSKLLNWVAMIVLPFALLGAVVPGALAISLGIIGILFVVVIIDALWSSKALAGIHIELADVIRMSKDREAKLEIRVRNERQVQRTLRLALPLPREIASDVEQMDVILPAQSEWSRLVWSCTPAQRGNYRLHSAFVETHSPLGFWAVRGEKPIQAEIRVYPNLLSDRKSLAALFLNRGAFGLHAQRQIGKGRDFEKLREYVAGDSFDEIHWKATARRGKPITKVFQIERTQEVYVIVDASRLSARKTVSADSGVEGGAPILERYVTAALVLGLAAEQQGDLFGLLTFTDKVEKFVRAKNGKAHYSACRDALYTLQPKIATPDFDELCTFIRLRLRRRALLLFLTSLDDPALAESFVRNLELIRRQHVVLVNMIQPPAATALFTNPNLASVDDLYQHLGGHLQWHKLRELGKVLQRRGVQFSLLQNERLSAELVSQYLSVKQRQLV
jgi:uncharacterized protein (DUF58 family)